LESPLFAVSLHFAGLKWDLGSAVAAKMRSDWLDAPALCRVSVGVGLYLDSRDSRFEIATTIDPLLTLVGHWKPPKDYLILSCIIVE
jgi:hypothetical protein